MKQVQQVIAVLDSFVKAEFSLQQMKMTAKDLKGEKKGLLEAFSGVEGICRREKGGFSYR